MKVVAVDHLRGGRGREVFYSTETDAPAEQMLHWFSRRWPVEVTFHDCNQHLGIEEPENRTTQAARRTAPVGLLLYSLTILWHEFIRSEPAPPLRRWPGKTGPSFADMLAALRSDSLEQFEQTHLSTPAPHPAVSKILSHLKNFIQLAA